MLKEFKGGKKVDSSIKPLSSKNRHEPVLNVGYDYFVSFSNNNAYPCTLLKVINEFDRTEVMIEIPMKAKSKKGYTNSFGITYNRWTQTNIIYATEIGLTPEDAVRNQVG